jgi:hypothetical protein
MSQSPILTGAKVLLSELPYLLSPELAQEYSEKITTLIIQIENQDAQTTQLNALLRQSPPLQQWMQKYIEGQQTEDKTRSGSLPGNSPPIASTLRYECLECSKSLKSPQLGIIPKCPDHPNANIKAI